MRQLGFEFMVEVALDLVVTIALIALPIALVLTLALISWFRHRVKRSMQAAAGATASSEPHRPPPGGPVGELQIEQIGATRGRANAARTAPLLTEARRHTRQVAAIYAAAAGAWSLFLAAASAVTIDFSTDHVLLAFALVFSGFFLLHGTPLALAPTVVLKKHPCFLLLAVLALLAMLRVLDVGIGTDSVGLWLMEAGVPTAAILLQNIRHLRAISPIVFTATLLLLYGLGAGVAYASLYALDAIGPVRFVRHDLADLPYPVAAERYFAEIWNSAPDKMLDKISVIWPNFSNAIQFENLDGFTTQVGIRFGAIWLAATVVGVALAWVFVRWLARRYQARRASDQMLTIDVLMMILTIWVFVISFAGSNWIVAAGALVGLGGYRLVARWGLRRHQRSSVPPAMARTLLLLRVFGFDRRAQRLLEDLGQRWRYIGPIRLIGGTDLAYTTIEPHEFFEFLNGRLSRAFIRGSDDLEQRLLDSTAAPDPDGLFRIEDFFCHVIHPLRSGPTRGMAFGLRRTRNGTQEVQARRGCREAAAG